MEITYVLLNVNNLQKLGSGSFLASDIATAKIYVETVVERELSVIFPEDTYTLGEWKEWHGSWVSKITNNETQEACLRVRFWEEEYDV